MDTNPPEMFKPTTTEAPRPFKKITRLSQLPDPTHDIYLSSGHFLMLPGGFIRQSDIYDQPSVNNREIPQIARFRFREHIPHIEKDTFALIGKELKVIQSALNFYGDKPVSPAHALSIETDPVMVDTIQFLSNQALAVRQFIGVMAQKRPTEFIKERNNLYEITVQILTPKESKVAMLKRLIKQLNKPR